MSTGRSVILAIALLGGVAAQEDKRFAMVQIDGGAAESAAVADFNNDGRLDIVSAESWYEAPRWTKRPIRTGATSVSEVEILEGLQPGDRIIISNLGEFERVETVRLAD